MSLTDEADADDLKQVDAANFRKIHDKAAKVGYADGVAAGNDSVFQLGFDTGYADGLRTGFELEKFASFCTTISNRPSKIPSELLEEAKIYNQLNITKVTSSEHFKYTSHQDETLDDISKHQHDYVDNRLKNFEEKLPLTKNLLATQDISLKN